ncbi:MAG: formate dehydrogenase accessory sulfurtransferase FdhD [Methanomicrobiales archaeon]|nr:formate dehydrogenase accessory sulfurtransferase FdhD [Methanomicrobiales archaeon]
METIPCIRISGTSCEPATFDAAAEAPLALFVNGRHITTLLISPGMERELVVGFLVTEQIVGSETEIESMRFETNRASVLTTNPFKIPTGKKTVLSGCGGSTSYIDTAKLPSVASPFSVGAGAVAAAAAAVLAHEPEASARGAVCAGLARDGEILYYNEDIGRDNALDRLIGWGVLGHLDFSRSVAVTSAAITSEAVRKCLVAGISVLVSSGAATGLAVATAQATGLCLIAGLKDGIMQVLSRPERITGCNRER